MRASTRRKASPRPRRRPASARKRAAYFAAGALLGGLIGYGFATGGPAPPPWSDPLVLRWTGGLGLVVGTIFALATDRVLAGRSMRSAGMWMDDDRPDD